MPHPNCLKLTTAINVTDRLFYFVQDSNKHCTKVSVTNDSLDCLFSIIWNECIRVKAQSNSKHRTWWSSNVWLAWIKMSGDESLKVCGHSQAFVL